jgi:hypothetical protein
MLAFLALTDDEPPQLALDYLKTAHERLSWALETANDPQAAATLREEAKRELAEIKLFLLGLSMAANPADKTPVNLVLKARRGRPRKNIVEREGLREAGRFILDNKQSGYLAAAYEAADKYGVDRTKAQAVASRMERMPEFLERMKFLRQASGHFHVGEESAQRLYRTAIQAVDRMRSGSSLELELAKACAQTGESEETMKAWIKEVGFRRAFE